MAIKGYDLLKGKQGKGKLVIIIIAVILGVVLGTFGPSIVELASYIFAGELPGMTVLDIPGMILVVLLEDSGYATGVGANLLMGFLLSGLCVFSLLKKTAKQVSDVKVVDLP